MKELSFLLLLSFAPVFLRAQPPICGNSPAMTSFCSNACIICDIDGFTGRNNSSITGQAPPGFCTTEVHHMQWIGFIAGTTTLSLEIRVSNCQRNQGLEIGLYESLDCTTFRRISECDTDIKPGEVRIFNNTVPLVVGQYYYFVMDGSANDICDWTIKVLSGSTRVSPLEQAAPIIMPDTVCQGSSFMLTTSGISGATFYNWKINGTSIGTKQSLEHTFAQPGNYEICLDAFNVCNAAPQACRTIEVLPLATGKEVRQLCFGECFDFYSNKYCETGLYEVRLPGSNGCDSVVTLDLLVDDRITASTQLNICQGDTLILGEDKFYTAGMHEAIIKNQEGCNIYMSLDLKVIICQMQASADPLPVKCNGENSGVIRFRVDQGTPPFTYYGFKVENPSVTFSGTIGNAGEWALVDQADEGNYYVTIEDEYDNRTYINIFVTQPPALTDNTRFSDYNGYEVACHGEKNGYIAIIPKGGTAPYTIRHQFTESPADSIGGLPAGVYRSSLTDANGCRLELTHTLAEPEPLLPKWSFMDPGCDGLATGAIIQEEVSGGVPPYLYQVNTDPFVSSPSFLNLTEGPYRIEVKDKNDCTHVFTDTLKAAEIPVLSPQSQTLQISLGNPVQLVVTSNLTNQVVTWTPDDYVACRDCLQTQATPREDTEYTVKAISEDGCETTARVAVSVEKRRSFTMANIFTPDKDGINDRLTYIADTDVEGIEWIAVYDRWGSLVYRTEGLSTGIAELIWDGTMNGRDLSSGIYTWNSRVRYIDGIVKVHSGTISLIR